MAKGRLPGTIINQAFRPGTSTPRDFPRYASFVAKGLDIKLFRDAAIVRGERTETQLFFSGITYIATLGANPAVPDKQRSRLYTSDGRTVSATRWNFSESVPGTSGSDQVVIDPDIFDASQTYLFDYVTTNADVLDELPVDDLREVIAVGDNASQIKYIEGTDFRFTTALTGPDAGTGNTNPTLSVVTAIVANAANTGTGTVVHNSSTFTHEYNRALVVTATAVAGVTPNRLATLEIEVLPTSSGATSQIGRSNTMGNIITVLLDETVPSSLVNIAIENGITLDFAFGATNFVVNDAFSFQGNGPAKLELADAMSNTNQFSTLSAVVPTAVGPGEVFINPQSDYSDTSNRPYQLECTASAGVGDTRTASFIYRTTPDLLTPDGTVTATNASAVVAGLATQFTSDFAVGDKIFIGVDTEPVEVLTVDNDLQITLTAVYAPATQAAVKALRSRENTNTIVVLVTAAERVTLERGIFLDFSFGPLAADNFTVTDFFDFTATSARNTYNGKENRTYDFTVTATADHQTTASYSGDTAKSGFGSVVFSEGNPLVLANNLSLNAINMTAVNRFDAAPPADTFSLSLTFEGTVDWDLERDATETIASSDILRDLTGQVTGTVGAYFVQTKRVPSTVLYVSGPSPTFTNITFSQVTDTNIIYFTTNPGVNLTVAYQWKGPEPTAGATYYISGYQKRPDSDYDKPQLFFTKDAARDFLAPMTPDNDAAISNEISWEQDELSLPGVVVFLVRDADDDGVHTTTDYVNAIGVAEQFTATMDITVVNQFSAREEFRDSTKNMNDAGVARHRIAYYGYPVNYPIGDEFTSDSRVYVARQELQIFEESVARGTLAIVGNSWAKKTISVNSLGNQGTTIGTTPTQVTLDGSFLAVALAARVASFDSPSEAIYNKSVSGFDEIEPLNESEMIRLLDAGIIPIRVEGSSGFYEGTVTTDETEPSTQQLSGTVQRQYVLARLKDRIDSSVIGFVADSPEEVSQRLGGEVVTELGSMISEGKIAPYIDPETGTTRPIDPTKDVIAFRDSRDPTQGYFRASWYQKYPILNVDGLVAVDAPTP